MTKSELKLQLKAGKAFDALLPLRPGQECEIFKADRFEAGDSIIYVPDVSLNEIPVGKSIHDTEQIEDAVSKCYTGNDFLEEVGGDAALAERLFWYCDWQHPSSASCEIVDEEDDT